MTTLGYLLLCCWTSLTTNSSIDPIKGPTAETLIRFVDTIVNHIKARHKDKPAPQAKTVKGGIQSLVSACIWKFPEFKLSAHELTRIDTVIDTVIDTLSKEGKLLRGTWRKREWVGIALVEKLTRAFLQAAIDRGCLSWDVILCKVLSIVLMSALACRSGDIALTQGYTNEYLRWEDVQLKLGKGGDTIDDLEADVTLRSEKGKK